MKNKTYLQILGITTEASLDEIKQAYRDLVMIWHPDRFPQDNERLRNMAQEKLKEINAAYDFITNLKSNNEIQADVRSNKDREAKTTKPNNDNDKNKDSTQKEGKNSKPQRYKLRSIPVCYDYIDEVVRYGYNLKRDGTNDYINEYLENDFHDNEDGTVTDYSTGLMWQKGYSEDHYTNSNIYDTSYLPEKYWLQKEPHNYIFLLNKNSFAGYNDWRVPTIAELASLVDKEKQSNGLYINPIFDYRPYSFTSTVSLHLLCVGYPWAVIEFENKEIERTVPITVRGGKKSGYIRAVRSLKDNLKANDNSINKEPIFLRSEPFVADTKDELFNFLNDNKVIKFKQLKEQKWHIDRFNKSFFVPANYIENDFQKNDNDEIVDFVTGLIWTKKFFYTFWKKDHEIEEEVRPWEYPEEIQKLLIEQNKNKLLGADNWRLPTIEELSSLAKKDFYNNDIFEYHGHQDCFLSSDKINTEYMWHGIYQRSAFCVGFNLHFGGKCVICQDKVKTNNILFVRNMSKSEQNHRLQERKKKNDLLIESALEPVTVQCGAGRKKYQLRKDLDVFCYRELAYSQKRHIHNGDSYYRHINNIFQDNHDGTVTDFSTGLMWQIDANTPEPRYEYQRFEEQANEVITNLNQKKHAGYDNWRIPSVDELSSIMTKRDNPKTKLFIDSIFDKSAENLSCDRIFSLEHNLYHLGVDYFYGKIFAYDPTKYGGLTGKIENLTVRAVRSIEHSVDIQSDLMRKDIGVVKWFDFEKGYGFIKTIQGPEIFMHKSNLVNKNDIDLLEDIEKDECIIVEFDKYETKKGRAAKNIQITHHSY